MAASRYAPCLQLALLISLLATSPTSAQSRTPLERDCDTLASSPAAEPDSPGVDFDKIETPRAIEACKLAIVASPMNARSQYQLGRAYQRASAHSEAAKWYALAGEHGYAAALHNLGALYLQGQGVPKEPYRAIDLMTQAAMKPFAFSQYFLAIAFLEGRHGFPADIAQGRRWLHAAAEAGHAQAQYRLGLAFAKGMWGLPQDIPQARSWLLKADRQHIAEARSALNNLPTEPAGNAYP